ncbi:MAG: cytochrome P450 [Microbacteriaceae bacterium]|nr:cytochrome P450 [Microbacteriaceae bacterium]
MFLAARHTDANAVLRNKSLGRIFTPKTPDNEWHDFNYLHSDSMLDSEPPKHTRLKSLVSKAFNPRTITALTPHIERLTTELLDDCAEKLETDGTFDVLADFAEPLPVKVIAHMLGFPDADEHLLRPWSQSIVKMYEVNPSETHETEARASATEFADYVHGLMQLRKAFPGTDLISTLAAAEKDGERLSVEELIATCVLLLNAGHEASVNGFGNGIVAALKRPAVMQPLRDDPRIVSGTALEEFLRFDSPLQLFERTATTHTEINGVAIRQGQKIAALLGAANRDPDVFDDADSMDLTREPNQHIAFGAGIHFCIGAPLARLEMKISLPALIERFPTLELAGEPTRRPTFVLRGYDAIPVT